MPEWDIAVGETLLRRELHDRWGGGRYGGMEPSVAAASVFLFTNPAVGSDFGYRYDGWHDDGSFHYTGDGQEGDQSENKGGNKSLLDAESLGRTVRLFRSHGTSTTYLGAFTLLDPPFYRAPAPDRTGAIRSVLVFRLAPVGEVVRESKDTAPALPPAPTGPDRPGAAGVTPPATPAAPTTPPAPPPVPAEAVDLLRGLVGLPLLTVTGRINRVLGLDGDAALVATERSPDGELVPAADVQAGLTRLRQQGSVRVHREELGYRSAFIGAVLATLPGAAVTRQPARVTLSSAVSSADATAPYFAVLDGTTEVKVRKEQGALRRLLLGDRSTGACALCGQDYPVEFLRAAHIKRRALCSDEERNDLTNVAMLACVFGCDALYETGYITVDDDGTVLTAADPALPPALAQRLAHLEGRTCTAFTPASAPYYDWHRYRMYRG